MQNWLQLNTQLFKEGGSSLVSTSSAFYSKIHNCLAFLLISVGVIIKKYIAVLLYRKQKKQRLKYSN